MESAFYKLKKCLMNMMGHGTAKTFSLNVCIYLDLMEYWLSEMSESGKPR